MTYNMFGRTLNLAQSTFIMSNCSFAGDVLACHTAQQLVGFGIFNHLLLIGKSQKTVTSVTVNLPFNSL